MALPYNDEVCFDAGALSIIVKIQTPKSFLCAVIVFGMCLAIAKSARMRWLAKLKDEDSLKKIATGSC